MHEHNSLAPADSPPAPALPHRRGLNASLETIRQGLQPIAQVEAVCQTYNCARSGRKYFLFANGQLRRQIGEGHSRFERASRRLTRRADYTSRRIYKRARLIESRDAGPADRDNPVTAVQGARTMRPASDIL